MSYDHDWVCCGERWDELFDAGELGGLDKDGHSLVRAKHCPECGTPRPAPDGMSDEELGRDLWDAAAGVHESTPDWRVRLARKARELLGDEAGKLRLKSEGQAFIIENLKLANAALAADAVRAMDERKAAPTELAKAMRQYRQAVEAVAKQYEWLETVEHAEGRVLLLFDAERARSDELSIELSAVKGEQLDRLNSLAATTLTELEITAVIMEWWMSGCAFADKLAARLNIAIMEKAGRASPPAAPPEAPAPCEHGYLDCSTCGWVRGHHLDYWRGEETDAPPVDEPSDLACYLNDRPDKVFYKGALPVGQQAIGLIGRLEAELAAAMKGAEANAQAARDLARLRELTAKRACSSQGWLSFEDTHEMARLLAGESG